MSEERDDKDKGFKVDDRRRFTSEGEARSSDAPSKEEAYAGGIPEGLTFSSFVIGLASQAFVFLGAVPDPQTGATRKDLPQAKAMIDILSMLGEKTAGNLDEHEARMMEEMLYELRMHYVKESRVAGSEGGKS
jgi:uncharacterized protein DUF1844